MLHISSVWRIRQIKFQKQSQNASILYLFFEILLGSEQLQVLIYRRKSDKIQLLTSVPASEKASLPSDG